MLAFAAAFVLASSAYADDPIASHARCESLKDVSIALVWEAEREPFVGDLLERALSTSCVHVTRVDLNTADDLARMKRERFRYLILATARAQVPRFYFLDGPHAGLKIKPYDFVVAAAAVHLDGNRVIEQRRRSAREEGISLENAFHGLRVEKRDIFASTADDIAKAIADDVAADRAEVRAR